MPQPQWIASPKYKGVRWYLHDTRKHGVGFDKCFGIRYQVGGKRVETILGWASSGWTENKAMLEREGLIEAYRRGEGPVTLKEKRAIAETKRLEDEAQAITLAQYWEESFAPSARMSKKEASFLKEESHFRHWLNPVLGSKPLQQITLREWDELLKTMNEAGLSPRMREYVSGTLRRILKHAYHRKIVLDPPPTGKQVGATAPKDNRRMRVLSPSEAEDILTHLHARDIHAYNLTRFAMLTGCRASEAFNLTWEHVDLDAALVTFRDTKNKDSRTIPMSSALVEHLSLLGPGMIGSHVFLKRDGTPYKEAPSAFKSTVQELGLNEGRAPRDKVCFHTLRHTAATRLAEVLGLRDLMDIMGWKVVAMAARYIKSNESTKRKAVESVAIVGGVQL